MDEIIAIRYYKVRALANRVIDHLYEEAFKQGFTDKEIVLKKPIEADYRLERDASSSEYNLVGDWQDEKGVKLGQLQFFSDGSFVVEQNVLLPHPRRSGWFVKAFKAWGSDAEIETETKLRPMIHPQSDSAA